MAAGRSGMFSACSAVFFLFVCWAIQLQYSASGEARLDMDQFGSSLGLINLSNLALPEVVNSGDDGNLLFGNVIPAIGRFGLISALGNYVEGEQTCCSSCKSENDDCLQNANAISHICQPNVVSRFHKLGRANATESQSQSLNLGQANVPAQEPAAHSNHLVDIILRIFLACMIVLTIGLPVWLYFKRPDLWQNRRDIAYAILRRSLSRPRGLLIWGNRAAAAA